MSRAVLLVLFVAECLTLLNIGNLLTLHVFLGMLLLGPVSLKIGSTLWRFTRYYTGSAAYVRKGPPAPLQRVTGPFVILTTMAVLGTGIMLAVEGPGNGSWGRLHHLSFFLWVVVIVIHLACCWGTPAYMHAATTPPADVSDFNPGADVSRPPAPIRAFRMAGQRPVGDDWRHGNFGGRR